MRFAISINHQQAHPIITIKDKLTGTKAVIYSFGGLLNEFHVPVKEKLFNCVEGYQSIYDAQKNITNGFKSAKICPFVCRLNVGQYELNNKKHTIEKHYMGKHAIHGLVYDGIYTIEKEIATDEYAAVELKHMYKKTDKGYPYSFEVTIYWKLSSNNQLTVTTQIQHKNKISIPFADGWHPYFTLGGKVDDYSIEFSSKHQLAFDEELIPTGKKIKDERFINEMSLKGIELDNSFELLSGKPSKCTLKYKGLTLAVMPDKNYPILQLYIPPKRNCIAIENLSGAPNNFNNGIGLLMLEPNKIYSFSTSYIVSTN